MAFPNRNDELCHKPQIRDQLLKIVEEVEKGFAAQVERADRNCDYWEAWNCVLGSAQLYAGNAKCYVPLTRNAIKALRTRFTNQLFPQTGRHVMAISHDDQPPHDMMALLEHYIRRADLRDLVVPALIVAGQVEGQMTVIVSWTERKRSVAERIPEPIRLLGIDMPPEMAEPVIRIKPSEVTDAGPNVEIVLDSDVCILPATSDNIEEAIEAGGSVTTIRRYNKERLEELLDDGTFDAETVEELLAGLGKESDVTRDLEKKNLDSAGIRRKGQFALLYRTWCKIDVGTGKNKTKRLVVAWFGGSDKILSCKLCPYWCDEPDVLTMALDKLPGNIKGMSQLQPGVLDMQRAANDALNEGLDQLTYKLLPPLLYDPEKIPNVDGLVLDTQSMWPAPPGSIVPFKFEDTLPQAMEVISGAERFINMSLGVSPAQLPYSMSAQKSKPNQAMIAMEQQIELQSTDNVVSAIEVGIMSRLVERFAAYDEQFRDRSKTVRSFGEFGLKVEMVTVPPVQAGKRWEFLWYGIEQSRTVQRVQQQIAGVNVLRGLAQDPSVMLAGKRLDMVPIIQLLVENIFDAGLAGRIFKDIKDETEVPVELENQMLFQGLEVHVSPVNNDPEHMQQHAQIFQQMIPGTLAHTQTAMHLAQHQRQMAMKAQAQQQQMMGAFAGGQQGPTGRPGAGGTAGLPRPGAQPAPPRQGQQPAGRIPQDNMTQSGVIPMPRRM